MTLDIMVPFWGDPDHLRACVRSVLAQTSSDWRLTVVDDCYGDESIEPWLASLGDPRVNYRRNETNRGITDNYRRCLELVTEEWMVFLGCDDMMLPGYVAAITEAARGDSDIIQPGVQVIDERGETVRPLADVVKRRLFAPRVKALTVLGGEDLAVSLLRGDWLYWPSLAFRTVAVRRHDFLDDLPLIQDLALVLDLTMDGSSLTVLPEALFAYRRHSLSASSASLLDGRRFGGEREYFEIAAKRAAERGWHRAVRAARGQVGSRLHALSLLPTALRARNRVAVEMLIRHALHRAPKVN